MIILNDTELLFVQADNYFKEKKYYGNYDLSDDEIKDITVLFFDKIDFGEHSNNSELHTYYAYQKFAEKILYKTETNVSWLAFDKDKYTIEQLNKKYMWDILETDHYKCRLCGEYIKTKLEDKVLKVISEPHIGHFATTMPPKQRCYNKDKIRLEIVMKSNKFIIANDLRNCLKVPHDFDDQKYDINTRLGRVYASEDFAEKGIMCMSTGNTTMELYKNKTGHIITNGYYPDLEEYDFNDNLKNMYEKITMEIDDGKYKIVKNGDISCSLWWIMGASSADIDMEKLKYDSGEKYTVINVKKGKKYIIESDSYSAPCIKIYCGEN